MSEDHQRGALTTIDRPTTLGLSPALAAVLNEQDAPELIAASPALMGEARDRLPILRTRMMTPATLMDLKEIIGRRFVTYPQSVRSKTEWDMWWADYEAALMGLSAEAIDAGLKAWIAKPESEFLPKPGRLRELALAAVTPTGRVVGTLRAAIDIERRAEAEARALAENRDFAVTPVRLKHVPKPREDREFVKAMAEDWLTDMDRKQRERPRPATRDTSGPLAPGHHVTQESLDLMRRE